MIYSERKPVFKFELITGTPTVTTKNAFVAVEMSPLVLAQIKHLPRLFFWEPA